NLGQLALFSEKGVKSNKDKLGSRISRALINKDYFPPELHGWPATWMFKGSIKVRLPNNRIVAGWIEDPKIYVDFFIVNIKNVPGVDAASLDCDIQPVPHTKVAAVYRCFSSGFLTATSGLNLASATSEIIVSTCQIHKAGIGGPLVDFDGNFVGMNTSRTKMEKTAYVRREGIFRFLLFHRKVRVKEGADDASRARMNSEMKAIRPSLSAKSVGTLSKSRKGALSKQVISRLSMSVVALTSFDVCTYDPLPLQVIPCIESSCPDATCFLTSINLIPYTYPRRKIAESLTIVTGWIFQSIVFIPHYSIIRALHVHCN
ncbi:hypothetical protein ZWY2020_010339, partial [Hordeum vulgare]